MDVKSLLMTLIERAKQLNASDIHFVIQEDEIYVQFRVGAVMLLHQSLSFQHYQMLLAYIKFESSLSLQHPKQPQSGLLMLTLHQKPVYCRVSILPTYHYQSLVLRLLYQEKTKSVEELSYFPKSSDQLKQLAQKQVGLILISGATGAGKTTTAYALMKYLNEVHQKTIITLEDPVECYIKSFLQIPINEQAGMTYDKGLKEILRHDPDVIVIGEIRDESTARQAIRAALTGHLVISTVHAKSCLGTIHRLLDLGISVDDLEEVCVGIVNQRLVKYQDESKALYEILAEDELALTLDELKSPSYPLQSFTKERAYLAKGG